MIDPGAPFNNNGDSGHDVEESVEWQWRVISAGFMVLFILGFAVIEYFKK